MGLQLPGRPLPARSSRAALVSVLTVLVATSAAVAQGTTLEIPLDRWLVSERLDPSSVDPAALVDPLAGPEGALFPDRDLEVGPSYWTLVREDGFRGLEARTVLAVLEARRAARDGAAPAAGEAAAADKEEPGHPSSVLAHVYLKAPEDRTILLDATHRDCQAARAWLNGQHIELTDSPVQLRLAGGWNTLLVHLLESTACAPGFEAVLKPSGDIDKDDGAGGILTGIRVQASRPPGVRRHYPEAWVTLNTLEAADGLTWQTGAEDLTGAVRFDYVAWGRSGGEREDGARPTDPPGYDVTGEWDLAIYGPTGIQRGTAEFRMSADGTLEGRITEGDRDEEFEAGPRLRFRGNIEDGWVRGDRISFGLRLSAPRGQAVAVRLEGLIEDDFIGGSVEFEALDGRRPGPGPIGGFESRFEATRRVEGGREGAESPDAAERPQLPGRTPGERPGGRPGGPPGIGAQPTDEQLRARIRSQLLPPAEPTAPAPDSVAFELRLGGPRHRQIAHDLVPGVARSDETSVPFKRLRELALSRDGAEIRLRWGDEERETRRPLPPEGVLRALHGPITLTGWTDEGRGRLSGSWRVPEALSGFTLRLASPEDALAPAGGGSGVSVNGRRLTAMAADLCSPCREGERLDIVMTGATRSEADPAGGAGGNLEVRVVEGGFPAAVEGPDAAEWLEALRGDNRRYRELAARYGGGA